ncbi:MAG: hypothetical protein DRH50_03255 [Deltaproteobacteria bacterium]|nr:MAG: hypothetical protein DRH50_03255 [Deltaproteobacteria bacterium]
MNPCIKTIVCRAVDQGIRVLDIRRGWAGLVKYNIEDERTHNVNVIFMDKAMVRTIDRSGGTILHTSRTNAAAVKKKELPAFLETKPAASTGLLTKSQKTGPHGLKQFVICPLVWAACSVKFPEGNPI